MSSARPYVVDHQKALGKAFAKPKRRPVAARPISQPVENISPIAQEDCPSTLYTPPATVTFTNAVKPADDREKRTVAEMLGAPPILYEGNFTKWDEAVKNMFEARDATTFIIEKRDEEVIRAELVKRYIHPELLARIPVESRSKYSDLREALAVLLTTKFRLMDLPKTVRGRIFEEVLARAKPVILFEKGQAKTKGTPPALTMTSSKIRQETMPIYFEKNIFAIHLPTNAISLMPLRFEQAGNWAKAHKRWLPHLRAFRIQLESSSSLVPRSSITSTYTPESGLAVAYHGPFFKAADQQVRHVCASIENCRKVVGLTGEVVAMVLVGEDARADMWMPDMNEMRI